MDGTPKRNGSFSVLLSLFGTHVCLSLFPFRKDPSSFGWREPLHCIFHGTFLPSSFSSSDVVVVVTVDFSFWAASSLPLPYLIKMVTAVISCCERRDATRRYGRPFPFSFFHMSLLVLVTLLLAFSLFLSYGRCERENVNGARPLFFGPRVCLASPHTSRETAGHDVKAKERPAGTRS